MYLFFFLFDFFLVVEVWLVFVVKDVWLDFVVLVFVLFGFDEVDEEEDGLLIVFIDVFCVV